MCTAWERSGSPTGTFPMGQDGYCRRTCRGGWLFFSRDDTGLLSGASLGAFGTTPAAGFRAQGGLQPGYGR
jgi:hypothetical protein